MDVAGDARTIAAALNHSAFNIGNSIGAALGGAVIAAGFGFKAPGWLGIVLALLGVLMTMVSYGAERRSTRRAALRSPSPSTGPITAPIPLV
jgi:DHA1 family inner membrane transport protein